MRARLCWSLMGLAMEMEEPVLLRRQGRCHRSRGDRRRPRQEQGSFLLASCDLFTFRHSYLRARLCPVSAVLVQLRGSRAPDLRPWRPPAYQQVELFDHPHLLLLQVRNSSFKLPGGGLRTGEQDVQGLKRKLSSKLSVDDRQTTENGDDEWQIGECTGMWWRSEFEAIPFPFLPP